jgi:hypothetical protein
MCVPSIAGTYDPTNIWLQLGSQVCEYETNYFILGCVSFYLTGTVRGVFIFKCNDLRTVQGTA